ncbi:MAG: hypothetical protein ACOX4L_00310 [Bacillota bacterium]|jgi:hypothetical protein
MKKKLLRIWLSVLLVVIIVPVLFLMSKFLPTRSKGDYWLIDTSNQKYLTHTSIPLCIGDEYISSDNKIYRIIRITKNKVYVKQIK